MKISQIDDPYGEFLELIKNFQAGRIDRRRFRARVQVLCSGNTDLIFRFNTLLKNKYQIKLKITGVKRKYVKKKKKKKVEENRELPWDVLDNICKTLDFHDLFQFAGVCKNWKAFHKIYWTNFIAYQEPLLLRNVYSNTHLQEFFSLISIPNQKIYSLKKMECLSNSMYVASSSGYFIKAGFNDSFQIFNPFTRTKKVINASNFEVISNAFASHALLALSKCSEDFVLVVLCTCSRNLRVYQSRNYGWVSYSSAIGNQEEKIVHFVVLHSIIYLVTNKANIGVLSLNSTNIKFLKLKSTPDVTSIHLKLVNCDEQLLLVDLMEDKMIRNVYKIDFSTMNYVKLETLGDIALFYACNGLKKDCYALSNPNKWGYERNSVYVTLFSSTICRVYSWDDKKLQKCIMLPTPDETGVFVFDWCFRHLQYEIDYSLVE
ncbi:uncharacterized protein LOC123890183 [Trifolium pratense]|uniref:uncharacterized protein LOC123890183 n=1 Tax=Trifolium pratense TaxID=57577 RepID=UPI001E694588|nr:uncharacterized protein LOC123890183 [Trifolium pratense]XP_045795689.1 uncharacterized protein LOC123890183 [Trifolium pratense]XP_045795691.1 uncharacterized protein LOC123890183 [Trifolium pratense]